MINRLAVLATAVLLLACAQPTLSRSDAATKIKASDSMKVPNTRTVSVGEHCDDAQVSSRDPEALRMSNPQTGQLRDFIEKKYVTLDVKWFSSDLVTMLAGAGAAGGAGLGSFGAEVPSICRRVAFGQRGVMYWKSVVTPAGLSAGIPQEGGVIATHVKRFDSVTGISMNPDGTATAEFQYFWDPTDAGKRLGLTGFGPQPGTAMFKLYDDGWRLISS